LFLFFSGWGLLVGGLVVDVLHLFCIDVDVDMDWV
jgi:hypothetical protein